MTSKKIKSVKKVGGKKAVEPIKDGLYFDMPNDIYHHQFDFKDHYISSSQAKALVESPDYFCKKYITKVVPGDEGGAHFDVGTALHTLILEPHLWDKEIAIFTGTVRRGKAWEEFRAENKDKAIITEKEEDLIKLLGKFINENPAATHYLNKDGWNEASLFTTLYSDGKSIFTKTRTEHFSKLDKDGWADGISKGVKESNLIPLKVKMRFDKFTADGDLLDLKSTSDNPESKWAIENIERMYNYSFSAAWYHVILDAYIGWQSEVDMPRPGNFFWIYASKKYYNTQVYRCAERAMAAGRAKVIESLLRLTEGITTDWAQEDGTVQVYDVTDKTAKWYGVDGLAKEEKPEVYTAVKSSQEELIEEHFKAKEDDLDDL
jgi:hypothetical protein